jgi:hypothetical protein
MTTPTSYPTADQYGEKLLTALGSFWYWHFQERDKLYTHLRSVGHRQGQVDQDYLEAVALISRQQTPVFHTEDWYLMTLRLSDRDEVKNVYGQSGLAYGGGARYGDPQTQEYLFPLPSDDFLGQLTEIPYTIYNRVLYPSKTWTFGVDFDINKERGLIRFLEDPFQSEYVAKRDIYDDDGAISDQEIGLWVHRGQWDQEYIYQHWSFAVGLVAESTELFKDLTNALWDAYAYGSNMASLQKIVAALLGVPFTIEPTEHVEDIITEPTRKIVTTDKHVYEFQPNANIIVNIGDTLYAGQELSDVVTVVDFAGNMPDYSELPGVALTSNYMSGGYFSELIFENGDVALEYGGVNEGGKAVVTFRIQGYPADVELFFENAMEIAMATGQKTLAELLDLRDNPATQPLPVNLPAQINPLEFAIDQIMRNNLWFMKIKTSAIDPDAPGIEFLRHMRAVVPPHTSLLIFVEIAPSTDTIDLSTAGDDDTPGAAEDTERFSGVIPTAENIDEHSEASAGDPSYRDVVLGVFKVAEECR